MATRLIFRTCQANMLDTIPTMTKSDCMKDAEFICKDGTLKWSALLISQWSQIARLKMKELGYFITSGSPLTFILPWAQTKDVAKLLSCTVKENVGVTAEEVREMQHILCSLGSSLRISEILSSVGEFSLTRKDSPTSSLSPEDRGTIPPSITNDRLIPEEGNDELPERNDASEQTNARTGFGDGCSQRTSGKLSVPDAEESQTPSSSRWQCSMCPKTFGFGQYLLEHLCATHFQDDLLRLWGRGRDVRSPCQVCGKRLFGDNVDSKRKPVERNEIKTLCKHLGIRHGYIYSLPNLSNTVRQVIKKVLPKTEMVRKDLSILNKMYPNCSVCNSANNLSFLEPGALRSHLAQIHYSESLLKYFSGDVGKCHVCKDKIDPSGGGWRYKAVHHVMVCHKNVFYKLLSAVERKLLTKGVVRKFVKVTKVKSNAGIACPLCQHTFTVQFSLIRHLCRVHFREQLLDLCDIKVLTERCNVCGASIRRCRKLQRGELERSMADHIGRGHGRLAEVMPEDVKDKIDRMNVKFRSSSRLQNGRKNPLIRESNGKDYGVEEETEAKSFADAVDQDDDDEEDALHEDEECGLADELSLVNAIDDAAKDGRDDEEGSGEDFQSAFVNVEMEI